MNTKQVTIAITGIGAPLGQSIARAALASKRKYNIIVADITDEDAAIFPDLKYWRSVHISSPLYEAAMINFLRENRVSLIFLGSEREMLGVIDIRKEVESESGANFALSDKHALSIGMDKLLTVDLLREAGLPYPRTRKLGGDWQSIDNFVREVGYPCIVKGRRAGQPFIVRCEDDLKYHFRNYKDGIIQEFLGDENSTEYTVGLFYAPEYGVNDAYCMERVLRYGLTWRGWYRKKPDIEDVCRRAVDLLKPSGSVNIQLRYHRGKPTIHEFNVRCSSSTVFRALSGWNEIDMAVDYFVHQQKPRLPAKVQPGMGIRFFHETWISGI